MAEWLPIETAPKNRTSVLVSVPSIHADRPPIVGEAYFDPAAYEGTWWWAGTGVGDYHASPIEEGNSGAPTHWMPLPAPPAPHS